VERANVNHHHRKVLKAIFSHPVSANIAMKDVESVFRELGAEVSAAKSGKLHVRLNDRTANFSHAGHSLPKQEVAEVRAFITQCGIDPDRDYPT
jgi:hypothetical protein